LFKYVYLGDSPLTDISVTLSIKDEFGVESEEKFAIGNPELILITNVDGSGTLAGKSTGRAEVRISIYIVL
jgi:hypothetical protein